MIQSTQRVQRQPGRPVKILFDSKKFTETSFFI